MANKYVNCFRCNTQIDLSSKNISNNIKCPHCNLLMRHNYKTLRKIKYVRYLFVLLICFALAYCMNSFSTDKNTLPIFLLVLALAFATAMIAERVCIWITWVLFGLEYEIYDVKKEEQIRKQKEKEERKKKERKKNKR